MRRCFFVLLLAAVGAAGCGGPPPTVEGRVTYKGRPVTSGTVILVGENGHTSGPGYVRPDGTYFVPDAPTGTVRATLDSPPPAAYARAKVAPKGLANDPEVREEMERAAHYVAIPLKYRDAHLSDVAFEVKKGKNVQDIELR